VYFSQFIELILALYGLIVSGKEDAHADEEPKDKKKRKVISVLQKWQHCDDAPTYNVFTFQ
jgi:hypothetical protein